MSSDCETPLVLSSVAAPPMVSVPVPRAELVVVEPPLLTWRVLVPLTVMPPERVLKPPSFKVPAPATVRRPLPERTPRAGLSALTARVCPTAVIVQAWAEPSAIGTLIAVAAGAPVAMLIPLDPSVRTPKAPWLMVTAPVLVLLTAIPWTEKFWSSVVVKGVAPAFVALKVTVLAVPGVNPASVEPFANVDQLVAAPVEVLAYQLEFAVPVQ